MKGGYQLRTLNYFNTNRAWCLEIEDMFRGFLRDKTMRLAFKPMSNHRREFVRDLADAYGLDSESVDHEPYRRYEVNCLNIDISVEVYKNNRAAPPRYSLSEAAKLKVPHPAGVATSASSGLVQLRKITPGIAYNAIFLEGVKGTVLQADLQTELNAILRPSHLVFSLKVIHQS